MNRKHYLDNLRYITILLLFPYHTFMIYNNWGERFYVNGPELFAPSLFIKIGAVWMMPLLFAVAGMSSAYALEKRSITGFAKERINRLLIPLIFGLLLIVPIQPFIAQLFRKGSAGYLNYFVDFSDLSGTGGGFTTGQLWFVLFLFVITMISLPLMATYNRRPRRDLAGNLPVLWLIPLGIIPVLVHPLLNVGGKCLGEALFYFLAGYFVLANEGILRGLERYRFWLLGVSALASGLSIYFDNAYFEAASWLSIIAILGLGRRYLDFRGKIADYLSKASFGVYLFHQSWIVVSAYFVLKLTAQPGLQIPLILIASVPLTFGTYELSRRLRPVAWMFGLNK